MSAAEGLNQVEYEEARRLAIKHRHGSASLLQRKMLLPYKRAKALVEDLPSEGVLSEPANVGLRLLRPGYALPREFNDSPQAKHVRLLRDLALYLLESEELGSGDIHLRWRLRKSQGAVGLGIDQSPRRSARAELSAAA